MPPLAAETDHRQCRRAAVQHAGGHVDQLVGLVTRQCCGTGAKQFQGEEEQEEGGIKGDLAEEEPGRLNRPSVQQISLYPIVFEEEDQVHDGQCHVQHRSQSRPPRANPAADVHFFHYGDLDVHHWLTLL